MPGPSHGGLLFQVPTITGTQLPWQATGRKWHIISTHLLADVST